MSVVAFGQNESRHDQHEFTDVRSKSIQIDDVQNLETIATIYVVANGSASASGSGNGCREEGEGEEEKEGKLLGEGKLDG